MLSADTVRDLILIVGQCDLYFMVKGFCLIFLNTISCIFYYTCTWVMVLADIVSDLLLLVCLTYTVRNN